MTVDMGGIFRPMAKGDKPMRLATVVVTWLALAPVAAALENVVVLVRHAEKVDDSRDPELSTEGKERARALASMLKDMELEIVYSTDFIRTRETARPLAEILGLEVKIYDGGKLPEMADRLRALQGRALVVGHSNSTPALVRLLGGAPGSPIEDDEYDRVYLVVPGADGPVTTLLRFSP